MFCFVFCLSPSLTHLSSLCLWYLHLTVPFPSKFSFFRVIYNSVAILLQEILECGVRGVPSTAGGFVQTRRKYSPPPFPPSPPHRKNPRAGEGVGGQAENRQRKVKKPEQIVCAWQLTGGGGVS